MKFSENLIEEKPVYTLTKSQQYAFDAIERTAYNFLLIGKPGVGKSVVINTLTSLGEKFYTLAAPTGLAALNINGKTLHSIFRIPVSEGILDPSYDRYTEDDKVVSFLKYRLKHLIIDECSMIRADTMDYIDRVLKHARGSNLPFGGVQVILVGDFFQLPPVARSTDKKQLEEAGYESHFLFHAKCFTGFRVLVLDEVLRQKGDNTFIDILQRARMGTMLERDIAAINKRVGQPVDMSISLCSTNREADKINNSELRKLKFEHSYTFEAEKFGKWPADPVPYTLEIKVGAQVMVKLNKADVPPKGDALASVVVNGTIGKVTSINVNLTTGEHTVTILTDKGDEATIYVRTWERKIKEKNEGVWEERVIASYTQMPLILAWAISIHKSQGQTFSNMHVDASRIFEAGQMYVAMSRCKSLAGVTLARPVTAGKFYANRHVLKFNKAVESLKYKP